MNIIESIHPLIKHKISQLRKDKISQKDFKSLLKELTVLISISATTDLILQKKEIKTWKNYKKDVPGSESLVPQKKKK